VLPLVGAATGVAATGAAAHEFWAIAGATISCPPLSQGPDA
jgi:hypothetical protein